MDIPSKVIGAEKCFDSHIILIILPPFPLFQLCRPHLEFNSIDLPSILFPMTPISLLHFTTSAPTF